MDVLFSVVAVAAGFVLIRYRAWIARKSVEAQNRTWGFHFGERHARLGEVALLIVGLSMFLIAGITVGGAVR